MNDWLSRDQKNIWHPYTPEPHLGPKALLVRAEGAYVYDEFGRRYFDAISSWWCNIHGHCHPRLVAAMREQAGELDQILFSPHSHPVAIELAERLTAKLPGLGRVFFSDDGSTAVEAALKMALQYWQLREQPRRNRFVSIEGAYHGDTCGALMVGGVSAFHSAFEFFSKRTLKATIPYCYRCPLGLTYPSCRIACLNSIRQQLEEVGDEVAALIVEPLILGASGMISYPSEYLEALVQMSRASGALIIFDEVFTGFGRTGAMFAADSVVSKPDIICLSKGLTSGMLPLAATVVSDPVYDAFRESTFFHGHTFTANPVSCAVALESLKIFDDEQVLEKNLPKSRRLLEWKRKFEGLPHVGGARCLGMILAIELVMNRETKAVPNPANGPGWAIAAELWKHGVWVRPLHQNLYVIPPYCTSVDELDEVLEFIYREIEREHYFR